MNDFIRRGLEPCKGIIVFCISNFSDYHWLWTKSSWVWSMCGFAYFVPAGSDNKGQIKVLISWVRGHTEAHGLIWSFVASAPWLHRAGKQVSTYCTAQHAPNWAKLILRSEETEKVTALCCTLWAFVLFSGHLFLLVFWFIMLIYLL